MHLLQKNMQKFSVDLCCTKGVHERTAQRSFGCCYLFVMFSFPLLSLQGVLGACLSFALHCEVNI